MSYLDKSKRSGAVAALFIGGTAATAIGVWFATRKASETKKQVEDAILVGGSFNANLTKYWPFKAGLSEQQRRMEGGPKDRIGKPLHTLEQHLADPIAHPYVAVAGDTAVWPYGQRIEIEGFPGVVFRVVDTGGHFRGSGKLYRVTGSEPLDICVESQKSSVPKQTRARIVKGDNFAKGALVATAGMKGQTVVQGDVIGYDSGPSYTKSDLEALARALESELGGASTEEMAAAAWAMRNRSELNGLPLADMLAPSGVFGAPSESGGYASTRKAPSKKSTHVAARVLLAPAEHDPTQGAVEFWMPSQQEQLRQLGDVHRAALSSGDLQRAEKYARFAGYASEDEVRSFYKKTGLGVYAVVGSLELLGRI